MRNPFIALAFSIAAATTGGAAGHQSAPPARVVYIAAERFSFTPSRVTVDQGSTIELRISSDDTSHGFKLTGPRAIDIEIPKRGRGEARVTFDATEAGTYTFECSRVCGAGHGFMRGTIEVKPRAPEPAS